MATSWTVTRAQTSNVIRKESAIVQDSAAAADPQERQVGAPDHPQTRGPQLISPEAR
jgi:hypothetical protein